MGAPLPICRHRGERRRPGWYECRSTKLVGLGLVASADCRVCELRDHPPEETPPGSRHLFPCVHWGPALDDAGTHQCAHPDHQRTTWEQCGRCSDYVFPYLTPASSPGEIRLLLSRGAAQQPDGWWQLPNVQQAFRSLARARLRGPGKPPAMEGRGIVLVGGGRYFPCAYVTLRVLRHLGCRLPVELWHFRGEMDDGARSLLADLGAVAVDAEEKARSRPFRFLHGHWWKGWQLKPYAVAHSRFAEVLYLDADCYPVRDPEFLFADRGYRRRGAVFWPDIVESWFMLGPAAEKVFGVGLPGPPLESGQLLIDKRRCWRELRLALWCNEQAEFYYRHLWGDKDTFKVAWALAGRPYAMLHSRAGWQTHTILQYDRQGEVLFQHRCRDKFRLRREDFASSPQDHAENIRVPALAHEDFCFAALEDLRRAWRPPA